MSKYKVKFDSKGNDVTLSNGSMKFRDVAFKSCCLRLRNTLDTMDVEGFGSPSKKATDELNTIRLFIRTGRIDELANESSNWEYFSVEAG